MTTHHIQTNSTLSSKNIHGRSTVAAGVVLCLMGLFACSCADPTSPTVGGVQLRTSKNRYNQADRINYSITNELSDTISLVWCSDYHFLQSYTNGMWVNFFSSPWDCLGWFESIGPGQTSTYTIDPFYGTYPPGLYRMMKQYSLSQLGRPEFGDPDTFLTAYSPTFVVQGIDYRTEKTRYSPKDTIRSVIGNPLTEPIGIYMACDNVVQTLQEQQGEGWLDVSPETLGCLSSVDWLPPNGTMKARLWSPQGFTIGVYRMRMTYFVAISSVIPISSYSNAFEVLY